MRDTKRVSKLIDHFDATCDGVQQRLIALDLLRERDELRAQVERLEKEREEGKRGRGEAGAEQHRPARKEIQDEPAPGF